VNGNSSKIDFTPEQVSNWLQWEKVLIFCALDPTIGMQKRILENGRMKKINGGLKPVYTWISGHSSPIWFRNIKIRKFIMPIMNLIILNKKGFRLF